MDKLIVGKNLNNQIVLSSTDQPSRFVSGKAYLISVLTLDEAIEFRNRLDEVIHSAAQPDGSSESVTASQP